MLCPRPLRSFDTSHHNKRFLHICAHTGAHKRRRTGTHNVRRTPHTTRRTHSLSAHTLSPHTLTLLTHTLTLLTQGGPGGSSLFGDFDEIGPLDSNLQPRNYTWLRLANLLFIDNPVGTGFSYTTDPKGFSTTDEEIGVNLVKVLAAFLAKYTALQHTPFWIFCESCVFLAPFSWYCARSHGFVSPHTS